jgi:tRNA 2-thiocytidine biosynthesis protein TtcA
MTARDARHEDHASLERRLVRAMGLAIADFGMIAEGDRIMVAVSGGKDSYTLHHLLSDLRRRSPVRFSIIAVNIDQGHPGYPGHLLTDYMSRGDYEFRMICEDTYSIVTEKIPAGKTYCSLCSRLRRGILYRVATELGCTKIALGHHRDDAIVTLLLNLFFSGQLKSMPPKLISDDGAHVVIRPLVYCAEDDIARYAAALEFPILPCDLCGSQQNLQRKIVSDLLASLEEKHPGLRANALAALGNVRPTHLFDAGLWQKLGLTAAKEEGAERGEAADLLSPLRLARAMGDRD